MIYEDAKKKLRGLAVIVLTPWTRDYEVDFEGLRENIGFIIDEGVREGKGTLFVACGCGEGPFMAAEEIKAVVETSIDAADGKVPVFFGTFMRDIKTIKELLKFGEEVGAYGVQIAPPYYTTPTLDEIFDFYKELNASTELGIVVYNNYYSTGRDMPASFVERLSKLEKVIGFKWASTNAANEIYTIARFKDRFSFLSNNLGSFIWGAMAGMKGIVSVMANFAPQYELKLWELLEKGEYRKAHEHMMKLSIPFYRFSYYEETRGVGIASHWKAAMEICGKPAGGVRPPQRPLTEAQKEKLREILVNGGVIKR